MAVDHAKTMVLLIGVSEFPDDTSICAIPNVVANVNNLKQTLVSNELVGIPPANITVSINEDKLSIERKLRNVALAANDRDSTLLIYYTGHGILNPVDFQMYFTTHHTSRKDIDIDGLSIEAFRKHVGRSKAPRKIVILDCCHSGAFIGAMGDLPGAIQAGLNNFEGTYVMTSAAEDEPSLFPVDKPSQPTHFTGKLIDILQNGIENDHRYSSLRDIYDKIENDFRYGDLPLPQQSNFNNADQMLFSVNKKYREPKSKDEIAWEEVIQKNTTWAYIDFMRDFSFSKFSGQAKQKINELVEEEEWNNALTIDNPASYTNYLGKYPQGKYAADANSKLNELRTRSDAQAENRFWAAVSHKNELAGYREYLQKYPGGRYTDKARNEITLAQQRVEGEKQLAQQQEAQSKREAEEKRLRDQEAEAQKRAALQAQRERDNAVKIQREKENQALQEQRAEEARRKVQEETRKKRELEDKEKAEQEARKKQEEIRRQEQEEQNRKEQEVRLLKQQELEEQKRLQRRKQGNMILEETTFVNPSPMPGINKIIIAVVVSIIIILIIGLKIRGIL